MGATTVLLPSPPKPLAQDGSTTYPTDPAASTLEERDPHTLPKFDSQSLAAPKAPVLYLPPLLSSPPETTGSVIEDPAVELEFPPLITETRLPDIDPASLSLHKALHWFKPVTPDYAATPYPEAFNWSELVLPESEERDWYCVVFRSKRAAGSDSGRESWFVVSLHGNYTQGHS